jgi:hypothetical protein
MMPMQTARRSSADARAGADYDALLARLGDRDRQNVIRHVTFCQAASEEHARLWKRIACALARLAPHAAQTSGQRAVRFYVSDGKYRRQLFALEDLRDGRIAVYTGNVLTQVTGAGLIRSPLSTDGAASAYEVCDEPGTTFDIEVLSAAGTNSAPEYYRHLLGWNRSAMKISVPLTAGLGAVQALEMLCEQSLGARTDG